MSADRLPTHSDSHPAVGRWRLCFGTTWWAIPAVICFVGCGIVLAESTKIPVDPDAEEEFRSAAGEGFQIKRTPHFLICFDCDDSTLREFIARLEATYRSTQRFLDFHDVETASLDGRLQIYFFDEYRDFHRYAARIGADSRGAAGFYHPGINRAAFYNALSAPRLAELNNRIGQMEEALRSANGRSNRKRRESLLRQFQLLRNERNNTIEAINQLVVQHEVAHQVFYNAGLHVRGGDNPPWIVEGLACLFESPLGPKGAGLGVVNQYRLLNFREALAGSNGPSVARPEDYSGACRSSRLVPLAHLLTDKALFDTKRENVENTYAEAWSLMHYLQRRRRRELGEYLRALSARTEDRRFTAAEELKQFEDAFGPVDDRFVAEWLEYILDLRVKLP